MKKGEIKYGIFNFSGVKGYEIFLTFKNFLIFDYAEITVTRPCGGWEYLWKFSVSIPIHLNARCLVAAGFHRSTQPSRSSLFRLFFWANHISRKCHVTNHYVTTGKLCQGSSDSAARLHTDLKALAIIRSGAWKAAVRKTIHTISIWKVNVLFFECFTQNLSSDPCMLTPQITIYYFLKRQTFNLQNVKGNQK